MADNLVSQPPLMVPVADNQGLMSKAWSIWMRDLYRRTSYKGGNAIDDNSTIIDGTIDTLEEVIVVVLDHEIRITANSEGIVLNASNLSDHEALEEAHGSNGDIVGFLDLADETTVGIVKRMTAITDAVDTGVNIVTANIGAAPATYSQTYTQSVTDLTNENKTAINQLASDLNDVVAVLNNLLSESKSSGQMTP